MRSFFFLFFFGECEKCAKKYARPPFIPPADPAPDLRRLRPRHYHNSNLLGLYSLLSQDLLHPVAQDSMMVLVVVGYMVVVVVHMIVVVVVHMMVVHMIVVVVHSHHMMVVVVVHSYHMMVVVVVHMMVVDYYHKVVVISIVRHIWRGEDILLVVPALCPNLHCWKIRQMLGCTGLCLLVR